MTEVLKKIVVNCETGVAEEIPLTSAEIAQLESDRAAAETERLAREAEATAKATAEASAKAKLKALGLSDAEVTALLG